MLVDIVYMLLFMGLGACIIKYRKNIHGWTGRFMRAEKYIGNGGTYFVILMVGLGMIFFGVTYPFGGLEMIFGLSSVENITPTIN